MSIVYPLVLPADVPRAVRFLAQSAVGANISPFTFQGQFVAHQGQALSAVIDLPPLTREQAQDWWGFLLALNGKEGTFLMGDPLAAGPLGSWAGSPRVKGAGQTGRTLLVDGFATGATVRRGDQFQLGSGASSRLYFATSTQTAGSDGELTLDIWPRLRESPADDAAPVLEYPVGHFRRATNDMTWDVSEAQQYGLSLDVMEAI